MRWVLVLLGAAWVALVIQNWQPFVPLVLFGQPVLTVPLGLAFGFTCLMGWVTAWGLDWWLGKPRRKSEPEPIVLEPDYVEYPRKSPPPADEDEWDFTEDWN
ncbi:MAG: hypothetical protein NZ482_10125 [Gloeomargarita sp. SKYG98]|nr:hypothetical protein [Gloeomargarita sp. SKYG98]